MIEHRVETDKRKIAITQALFKKGIASAEGILSSLSGQFRNLDELRPIWEEMLREHKIKPSVEAREANSFDYWHQVPHEATRRP